MQVEKRVPSKPSDSEGDVKTIRPQGAPRGLLHFYALLSIARKPMRGYDLIKEIEAKTDGAWRPGPGAVYPVLQRLLDQGHISVKKRREDGPTQILYEITPAGLAHIADSKKTMRTSTERMRLMSSLFIDLMEPDDLVRFVLNSFDLQTQLLRMIVESDKSNLGVQDKLFVLRQYRLNLERELRRASALLEGLEGKTGQRAVAIKPKLRKGRA
jgi:DNA-binding PadR family transcriptional regulator